MRTEFAGNVMSIAVLGVLLLLASALGRVTATNLGNWLTARPTHFAQASASLSAFDFAGAIHKPR